MGKPDFEDEVDDVPITVSNPDDTPIVNSSVPNNIISNNGNNTVSNNSVSNNNVNNSVSNIVSNSVNNNANNITESIVNKPKKSKSDSGDLRSETVVILPAPLSQHVRNRLERQKNKYWHFKFVHDSDFSQLENKLSKLNITVQTNYGGKKHADLTLFEDGNEVGKIHFLHANRPDICNPETFYVKLHFYDFQDYLFEPIKELMRSYFRSLDSPNGSNLRGGKKTRKRKRHARRKTRRS